MDLKEQATSADHIHQQELQAKDELLIDLISHLRHDWMNDIQVLYGYLRLNKSDKLLAFMETLKQKAAKESLISKLGVTPLIVYLQSFRVHCPWIQLEVDLEPDFQLIELDVDVERTAELVIAILDCFKEHTYDASGDDFPQLQLEWLMEEEHLHLIFDYRGGYKQAVLERELLQAASAYEASLRVQTESEFEPQWAAFTIRIPLVSE